MAACAHGRNERGTLVTRPCMNAKIFGYAYGNRERSQNNSLLSPWRILAVGAAAARQKVDLHTPQRPSEGNRSDGRRSSMTKRFPASAKNRYDRSS